MNLDFLKYNLIAHRGLHDNIIPENSVLSFIKAIEKNYIIELDVHILKDGNVVVFHDDNLYRMTNINKKIKDTTYDEIKDLKLLNKDYYIPLFKDILNLVNGRVPLLIELKYDTKNYLLEDKVIELLKDYKGLYAIQSFNPKSLIYLRRKQINIPLGILVCDFKRSNINFIKKIILKNMLLNNKIKPDFISVNYNYLNNKRIKKYKNNKLILTWTIRNKKDIDKYKCLCDNFIVENI